MKRRVVITGCGVISPIGNDAETFWEALVRGQSGIDRITRFDTTDFPSKIAGEIRNFDPEDYISRKRARRMDLFAQYAVAAAMQAVDQAGLEPGSALISKAGVIVGSGGGPSTLTQTDARRLRERGPRSISAYSAAAGSLDAAASEISLLLGTKGPSGAIVTACATGNSCVGEAVEMIRSDRADVMLAGGSDDLVTPLDIATFGNAKALSRRNDEPQKASRPFDKSRDGFVMGAGAGVVVLEAEEHAVRRGAAILAEAAGYGATTDAYHITAPDPSGTEAARAIILALQQSEADVSEVDYVNAHGTSTKFNDEMETRVLKTVLQGQVEKIPVSSNKSMIGHLVGGAGAVELVATVYAVRRRQVPPTINCDDPESTDMNYVAHVAQPRDIRLALSNSFGFGGHNAVLAVRRWEDAG